MARQGKTSGMSVCREKQSLMEAEMKLLTLNVDPVCIPDQEYEGIIRMSAADLHKICKDFKDHSENMRIQMSEDCDGIVFSCEVSPLLTLAVKESCSPKSILQIGHIRDSLYCVKKTISVTQGDMGRMKQTVSTVNGDENGLEVVRSAVNIDEEFPLRHLEQMTKAHSCSKRVEIYLMPQKPILLRYKFMEDGVILFVLAPRIPDEMDQED